MWTQTNLTGYFFVTKLSLSKRDQEQNVCFENGLICMRIKDHSMSIASYLASLWNRVLVQLEIGLLFLSIRHLHISHNTPCLPSPHLRKKKLHKHHVANFSWEHCYSQEKLKTKATNFFFLGGRGGEVEGPTRCIMGDSQMANCVYENVWMLLLLLLFTVVCSY